MILSLYVCTGFYQLVDTLAAVQLALEVLANLWCDEEEEEEEEEEEFVGDKAEKMEEGEALSNGQQGGVTVATLRECLWCLMKQVTTVSCVCVYACVCLCAVAVISPPSCWCAGGVLVSDGQTKCYYNLQEH